MAFHSNDVPEVDGWNVEWREMAGVTWVYEGDPERKISLTWDPIEQVEIEDGHSDVDGVQYRLEVIDGMDVPERRRFRAAPPSDRDHDDLFGELRALMEQYPQ